MSALAFLSPAARTELERLIDERIADSLRDHLAQRDRLTSPFMTITEVAEYLRCSRQRVDDLLSQRRLRRFKDGARTLVSRAELEDYVQERR